MDIGDELTNSIGADGQTSPSANLKMNGFKHTGVAAATELNQYARVSELIDQDHQFYVDTGAANAYVITPSPAIAAYEEGQRFVFRAANASTTASTLNVNALGAFAIQTPDGSALIANSIIAGGYYEVTYDANSTPDRWVMTSPSSRLPDAMFPATLPVASGVNLTALNATNLASGSVADARLSSQVCLKDSAITSADGADSADPGYRGLPTGTDETPVLADAGKVILATSNVTIPANASIAFPVGTILTVVNNTVSTLTIAVTSDTLRWAGTSGTDGTRTISSHQGVATLLKVSSTMWVISGDLS